VITRLLPREEWPRLAGTELEQVWPHLPAGAQVVVVEADDRIIGCWSLIPLVHCEGVWIDPEFRGNPRVALRLVRGMKDTARAMGAQTVLTAAQTPEIGRLAEKIGGAKIPAADHYAISLREGKENGKISMEHPSCLQQSQSQ